jgi:hypothetical protein
MSALLYLPGILVVLFKRRGVLATLLSIVALIISQVAIGWPFIQENPRSYLKFAFEFSRRFLYKWTVNWRFISEERFLSSTWARILLALHLITLVIFGFRWCRRDGGVFAILNRGARRPTIPPSLVPISADCRSPCVIIQLILAYTLYLDYRCYYNPLDIQSRRNNVCAIFALPILLLVRRTDTFLAIQDKIPSTSQVSGLS